MNRDELDETLSRPDQAGVFRLPVGDIRLITDIARDKGFPLFRINLAGCTESAEVLDRFAEGMRLPDWFGRNWDALADCLTDLSWQPAAGYVLVLENAEEFRAADEEELDTLVEILSDASASWSELQVPFWAFLVLPA